MKKKTVLSFYNDIHQLKLSDFIECYSDIEFLKSEIGLCLSCNELLLIFNYNGYCIICITLHLEYLINRFPSW